MRRRPLLAALIGVATLAVATPMALAGTISGQVFRDYNSNGARNAGGVVAGALVAATDAGMAGVQVRAFDNAGNQVGQASTAPDGTYSLGVDATGTVRVEFSTPSGYEPSFAGAEDATSVQFVSGAGASNVDYAVNVPGEYCQDNPRLVTCAMPYLANYPVNAPGAAVLDSPLGPLTVAEGGETLGGTPSTPTALNAPSAMGATWGVGADRGGNAYFGTYVKRHSPYGPGSTGSNGDANWIYKVNVGTGDTAPWVQLGSATLPAHVAAAPNGWPDYSADGYRSDNNPNDVFHSVGRAGLGDVDVTPDGSTLYTVEMAQADPKLWSVLITGPADAPVPGSPVAVSIPRPTALNGVSCDGQWHPMGLGMTQDAVLVGGVCEVEKPRQALSITTTQSVPGGSEGPAPGTSNLSVTFSGPHDLAVGDLVTLESFSRSDNQCALTNAAGYGPPNFDTPAINFFEVQAVTSADTIVIDTGHWRCSGLAATATTGTVALFAGRQVTGFVQRHEPGTQAFSTIAAVDLGYDKSMTAEWINATSLYKYDAYGLAFDWSYKKLGYWRAWNDWNPMPGDLSLSSAPEPMLSNIETQANGNLVLAFRDRWLDQTSPAHPIDYNSTPGNPQLSQSYDAAADVLVLCKSGAGYVKESDGACTNATGASMARLLDGEIDPAVRPNSPLYYWNGYVDSTSQGTAVRHPYSGLGGVATMPGTTALWATAYDISSINQQGVRLLGACAPRVGTGTCGPAGVSDGAILGGARFTASVSTSACGTQCWGKGNGLGDLELMCDSAPLQVGNRVWIDSNANGLQDAGESPVAGVTVHLYDHSGTLVGTAITAADGTYYFASNVSKPAAGDGTSVGGGITPGAAFTIRLDNPADFSGAGPLAPYWLTTAGEATAPAGADAVQINSKATLVAGSPAIAVAAHRAGANDHSFDVGFTNSVPPSPSPAPSPGADAASGAQPTQALVAIGDRVWFDANANGLQDLGERPLPGTRVILLTAGGTRARDAEGHTVPVQMTDARGLYLFDGLLPGRYRVRFVLPAGYTATVVRTGNATRNSNGRGGMLNHRIALTPVFTVFGSARGTTTPIARAGVRAQFADLTIDAGAVPDNGLPVLVTG